MYFLDWVTEVSSPGQLGKTRFVLFLFIFQKIIFLSKKIKIGQFNGKHLTEVDESLN